MLSQKHELRMYLNVLFYELFGQPWEKERLPIVSESWGEATTLSSTETAKETTSSPAKLLWICGGAYCILYHAEGTRSNFTYRSCILPIVHRESHREQRCMLRIPPW